MGSIFIDAKKIAYDIVDEYLSKGKKDIVFVSPKQNLIRTEDLILGIEEAYQKHGMTFDKDKQILPTSTHYEKSYPQFLEYFKNHKHDLVFQVMIKKLLAVVMRLLIMVFKFLVIWK